MVVSSVTQPISQDINALKVVWQSITLDSCPHHYNFHMHTHCSDGQLTPVTLIEQAVNIGLKGMAITDHHSCRGYQIAQKWLEDLHQRQPNQPLPHLWTGVEITSDLLGTEVHILGYGYNPNHPAMIPYLQGESLRDERALAATVINSLHQAGGLAVLAHPFRYRRSAKELISVAAKLGIDGVEAYYAYGNPKPWKPSLSETEQVLKLSQRYGLLATCGTDTHGVNLLQRI